MIRGTFGWRLKKTMTILVVIALIFAAKNSAEAQYTQQGSKLVGTGAVPFPGEGVSVAISADSSTAIVGGDLDSNQRGAAWVFTRTDSSWTQQGSKLFGTGSIGFARQGHSVAISADGNTAIVGGQNDSGMGAVWVFTRSGGVWTQQGAKLVGTGAVGPAEQGQSVSLSADGNTAIVGGPLDNGNAGAAWIFTRTGGVWAQQGSKLVGTGGVGNARQGASVALSADGNTAIVGGNSDNSSAGAAWVFTRSGLPPVWTQQGSKLVGTGAVGAAAQGQSVALSADGSTSIIGGFFDNGNAGAAWVFTRNGVTLLWTQQGSKLVGTGAVGAAFQGSSVSLSGDGNMAIVGGQGDSSNWGASWVFTRSGLPLAWAQQGSKLVGTGGVGGARQGVSAALSSSGTFLIVGGHTDNANRGAAWIFTRSGGVWTQQGSKLFGTGSVGRAGQGQSVSLSADGNTAIVGGQFDSNYAGAAWVFTRTAGAWTQQGTKLVGTGGVGPVYQGASVALSADGNTAIVGGPLDSNYAGAAWVFVRTGGVWSQQGPKLVGTGAVGGAEQGYSVSISADGNTAIVGGPIDNTQKGAAWVFTRSGGVWTQQGSKLVGLDAAAGTGREGYAVALSADGNTAIVGGDGDNGNAGAAWIYTRSGGLWNQQGPKLVGSGPVLGPGNRGSSVALSADGNTAIEGGYSYHSNSGAAWVFTRSAGVWTQQTLLAGTGAVDPAKRGTSVSLTADGNTAIVGGPLDNGNAGAAWAFTRSGSVWTQLGSKLVGTGTSGAYQGFSASLSADGNTVIAGGPTDNENAGAAWVFVRAQTTFQDTVANGWNMLSVQVTPDDYHKSILFPSAISNAFAYQGGYVTQPVLENGKGYWVKFNGDQIDSITGYPRTTDSIDVVPGWNIVGSISVPVNVSSITSAPGSLVTSPFFGYNSAYTIATTIDPGKAYWVKTNNAGKLYLSSAGAVPQAGRIRIVEGRDAPPSPPEQSGVAEPGQRPAEFALGQNYPNPFNPSTIVRYQLPYQSHVVLRVYDLLGQDVATLVDGVQDPGYKSVSWDASGVSSGIYYYRLTAGTFTLTKRMIVVK